MSTCIETVIIGGGQAGLASSYYLSQQDQPYVVLEQAMQGGNACATIAEIPSLSTPDFTDLSHKIPVPHSGGTLSPNVAFNQRLSFAGEVSGQMKN